MKPKVLVATTCRWLPAVRLALALADAGCKVDAVCPPRHPLTKTKIDGVLHKYQGLAPVRSFARAIAQSKPDLIIPCDDLATAHLYACYRREIRFGEEGNPSCTLIERSLGSSESFRVVSSRAAFMRLAQEEGIRVPRTEVISDIEELRKCTSLLGFPVVLKANGTSGGEGVRVVRTPEEGERAFHLLQSPPLFARAAKRALVNQDLTLIWPAIRRRRFTVNAQTFEAGRDATSLAACWNGNVLASLHFEVVNKCTSNGPASVVRLIENPDMFAAIKRIAKRLNLSGLHGFDFLIESETRSAVLIEINPRATQVGHLRLGPGRDLPAALVAAITGETIREAPQLTENGTIALFPQEWKRNPESSFLRSGYHDVPWEEPDLVRACVRGRQNVRELYSHRERIRAFSTVRLPNS